MDLTRDQRNVAEPNNPRTSIRHMTQHSDDKCLGLSVWLWCPGCQALHMPRFRCSDHGGPEQGPVWDGDPYSNPFTMSPSLLVYETPVSPRCHSYIKNGHWEFLSDCSHLLAGKTVPLEPLPDWLVKEFSED